MSLGDPAGIGAEVVAKSWERRREERLPPFFVVGDVAAIEAVWSGPISVIGEPADTFDHFDSSLPIIRVTGGAARSSLRCTCASAGLMMP